MTHDEALRAATRQSWQECKEHHSIYFQARKKAIAKAIEPLEHLRVKSEEATTAYKKMLAELMGLPLVEERTDLFPLPRDCPGETL